MWSDLQFEFTPSIKKVRNNRLGEKFVYNDETKRYVELEYAIHFTEIINGKSVHKIKEKMIPARLCTIEDFNKNDEYR